ncbi:hypothetical protein BC943DRAFT_324881 [Umbelopsis sp. AD052]|nr:hypothetical protein BC943DRAFT_324881 [Umbelopsis sp. AD052]
MFNIIIMITVCLLTRPKPSQGTFGRTAACLYPDLPSLGTWLSFCYRSHCHHHKDLISLVSIPKCIVPKRFLKIKQATA